MKTGLIDVGGGSRAVFGAGVMDRFLKEGISFDLCIGISAGCANVASYIAKQQKRNYAFYTEYTLRDEYMSAQNRRSKGCYLDVQYIYGTLSNTDGEYPLDYKQFCENPSEFIGIATDALTGLPEYFGKQDMRLDYYNVLMASSAMPYFSLPQDVNGKTCYDGSLSDPLPLEKALSEGCDKIALILNMPLSMEYSERDDERMAEKIASSYPKAAEALRCRAQKYRDGVTMAKELESEGIVTIIAPDDICGVDTFSKDPGAMDELYRKGYKNGEFFSLT